MTTRMITILALLIAAPAAAPAQDGQVDPAARDAIRALVAEYADAYNRRDAAALAEFWSPDAVYVNRSTGAEVVGRDAIAAEFTQQFADGDDSQLEITVGTIDFVSPNVAVENSTASLVSSTSGSVDIDYTAVYVRHSGTWLLDRVTDEDRPTGPHYDHLRDLQWLTGQWVDEDDEARIVTECNWTRNNNFLTRSFTVAIGDQINLAGMQIIGWDAADQQIRSWTFDSDGGISQGRWTQNGDRWFVQKSGVLADGRRAAATNIITREGDDSLTLESVHRTVDGELLPDISAIRVVRQ